MPFLNPITPLIPPRIIMSIISSGSRKILISWTPSAVIISGWCISIFAFIITTFTSRWIPWKEKQILICSWILKVVLKCTCLEIGHLAIVFFDVLAGKEANIGLRRIRKNCLRIGNCDPIGRMGSVKHPDDNCYAWKYWIYKLKFAKKYFQIHSIKNTIKITQK